MTILLFIVALLLLIVGAEILVRGASRLAAILGISPLVIGLTVVSFGTSAPELAVAIQSAVAGQAGITVGNVVGSNIFNILFILGLSATIVPLVVAQQLVRLDVPLMVVFSVVMLILSLDEQFGRADGLLLVLSLIIYTGFLIYHSRKKTAEVEKEHEDKRDETRKWGINIILVLGGLALLVLGSRWLVESAVSFARYVGVSETIVGLTIVAAGTSLPEVVTSVIAAIRGERDIAVGNVVGSNIFNIMGVLGLASLVSPTAIEVSPAVIGFDIPVMIAVALSCLPIYFTGGVISRQEGVLLLGYYVAYTLYLVLAASHHDALPRFSVVMLYFVIPITVVTLVILAMMELRRRKRNLLE